MRLESWEAGKKLLFARLHIVLTVSVFLYLFSLISKLLLPWLPQQAIIVCGFILLAANTVNEKSGTGLIKAVLNDLDKIPAWAHYSFFLIATGIFIFIKWSAIVTYLSRTENKLAKKLIIQTTK